MDSVTVHQRIRPPRHAFLVAAGDLNGALQATSINAALWGGIYNPIVPLTPSDERDGLLKAFDPDVLINLTHEALPADLVERFEHRIVPVADTVRVDERSGRRELHVGFNILPLVRHVHEKEVRFTPGPTRAAVPSPSRESGWPEFVAFAHGSYEWLPELAVSFEDAFVRGLRARRVELPELSPPPDYEALLLPLSFTSYGLRLFGRSGSFSSHIIFVGDHRNPTDLVEFWNIRATGRTAVFVPIAGYQRFEVLIRLVAVQGRYPINQQVENHADLQKGPSLDESPFAEACNWISTLDIGSLPRRSWRPRYGREDEFYVGDIHPSELEAAKAEEIAILQDRRMTPVKLITPPYGPGEALRKGQLSWSVEVTMGGGFDPDLMFSYPREPAVEKLIQRSALGAPSEVRLGRRGIVLLQRWVAPNFSFIPVATRDVIRALFRQAGIEAEPSQPGRYAEGIVKKMGSLQGCRVFKIRGVRAILDRLGDGSILTKGNMCEIVMSQDPDAHGQNWRPELYEDLILRRGQRGSLNFTAIFDVLLERRVVRPGFVLRCRTCYKDDWYHVSEFSEEYTCRFCFAPQRVNFASVRDWQYKADGLFQIPHAGQGSVAVILSLWRLDEFTHGYRGRYVTSQDLVVSGGSHCEVDYAYVVPSLDDTTYDLVLGEARGYGEFTDEDVQKMALLADRFPRKPYLAFSTLKDRFSEPERERLGVLATKYRVIAFTREELDPYHLLDRFERAPHKYAVTLRQLSESTLHVNVGPLPRADRGTRPSDL